MAKTIKKTMPKADKAKQQKEQQRKKDISIGIILLVISIIGLITYAFRDFMGILGPLVSNLTMGLFGLSTPLIFGLLMALSILLLADRFTKKRLIGFIILMVTIPIAVELLDFTTDWDNVSLSAQFVRETYNAQFGGGVFGVILFVSLRLLIGTLGVAIVSAVSIVLSALLILMITREDISTGIGEFAKTTGEKMAEKKAEKRLQKVVSEMNQEVPKPKALVVPIEEEIHELENDISIHRGDEIKEDSAKNDEVESFAPTTPQAPLQLRPYIFPTMDILMKNNKASKVNNERILNSSKQLENTLASFGVKAKVLAVYQGPTVTRFELQPDEGVKVSKIVGLSNDIALRMAAKAIRIEAPIPGKSAIGIEVPNEVSTGVLIREVIDSKEYKATPTPLPLVLGKDISGKPMVADITKMPHLLIAGATGSGKSVGLNSIITGILYKSKPEDVKMIMIDPKMVELSTYNGIPHLVSPVVTDSRQALAALNWAVVEMTRRYTLFHELGSKEIKSYNLYAEENNVEKLPYIVIIIDELADLMMVAANDVENAIIRLAQMARAAGIHLIIATQRPSAKIITGLIKSNVPSRMSFAVSSQMDSRIILDEGGAEKLIGNGDMLFHPVGEEKPIRIQGTFISEKELEEIVSYIKLNNPEEEHAAPVTFNEFLKSDSGNTVSETDDRDVLFDEAAKLIIESGQASTSMLQRRLKLGYARASRIIDQLTDFGIIAKSEGNKPREVLMTMTEFEERYL